MRQNLLTIDPGLVSIGYAWWTTPEGRPRTWQDAAACRLTSGTLRVSAVPPIPSRLVLVRQQIADLFVAFPVPLRVVIETPSTARQYYQRKARDRSGEGAMNAADMAAFWMAYGVILSALVREGVTIDTLAPAKASKENRHRLLPTLFPSLNWVRRSHGVVSSHEADALELGLRILTRS